MTTSHPAKETSDGSRRFPPKPKPEMVVGEKLEAMSVAELEARIVALKNEIERVEAELVSKRARVAAAEALFKN